MNENENVYISMICLYIQVSLSLSKYIYIYIFICVCKEFSWQCPHHHAPLHPESSAHVESCFFLYCGEAPSFLRPACQANLRPMQRCTLYMYVLWVCKYICKSWYFYIDLHVLLSKLCKYENIFIQIFVCIYINIHLFEKHRNKNLEKIFTHILMKCVYI